MSSITSLMILAMEGKQNGVSITEIATYLRDHDEEKKSMGRLTSIVRYHITELEGRGVVISSQERMWKKYKLADGVEIMNGKMVSMNSEKTMYEDDIGRIMRMVDKDGCTTIQMLDMM